MMMKMMKKKKKKKKKIKALAMNSLIKSKSTIIIKLNGYFEHPKFILSICLVS